MSLLCFSLILCYLGLEMEKVANYTPKIRQAAAYRDLKQLTFNYDTDLFDFAVRIWSWDQTFNEPFERYVSTIIAVNKNVVEIDDEGNPSKYLNTSYLQTAPCD